MAIFHLAGPCAIRVDREHRDGLDRGPRNDLVHPVPMQRHALIVGGADRSIAAVAGVQDVNAGRARLARQPSSGEGLDQLDQGGGGDSPAHFITRAGMSASMRSASAEKVKAPFS